MESVAIAIYHANRGHIGLHGRQWHELHPVLQQAYRNCAEAAVKEICGGEQLEARVIDDPLPFGARMALVEVPLHWLDKRVRVILLEDDRE